MNKSLKTKIIFILTALAVGGLSAYLTKDSMNIFDTVTKPPLAPPPIVFPIVWSILYTLMGYGAARVYLENPDSDALTVYWINLIINFFWSIASPRNFIGVYVRSLAGKNALLEGAQPCRPLGICLDVLPRKLGRGRAEIKEGVREALIVGKRAVFDLKLGGADAVIGKRKGGMRLYGAAKKPLPGTPAVTLPEKNDHIGAAALDLVKAGVENLFARRFLVEAARMDAPAQVAEGNAVTVFLRRLVHRG